MAELLARALQMRGYALDRLERLVTADDETCRLVYAAVEGRASHYNAAVQVFPEGDGSRVVWTIDLLPDELAPAIDGMMDQAAGVMKKTLAEA